MNLYRLQTGSKMSQQQEDPELMDLDGQDEDGEEGELLVASQTKQEGKILAFLVCIVIAAVAAVIFIGLRIALALEELPKIHLEYQQAAYYPQHSFVYPSERPIPFHIKPALDAMIREVTIGEPSPANEVELEQFNRAHRLYQHTMRQIEANNSHTRLDYYKNKQFSQYSSMTYLTYLTALDLIQLATFSINDFSLQYGTLSNQQRLYYNQRYELSTIARQNPICVVLTLTQEGLQSGSYFLALKSIFQQEYNKFKLIVINNPHMHMLDEVEMLLREFGSSRITLVDRLPTEKQVLETSFFVEGVVLKYCQETSMTLLLRDTGELIGRQVFKVINKIYEQQRPSIIFTHYILESANPLREKAEVFRYRVQLYPQNLGNSRGEAYRTKYLKIYNTDLLLKLSDKAYQRVEGSWISGLFEANLQFSMLQFSCGKYYLLDEIMYMASKYDVQNAMQVLEARLLPKLTCFLDEESLAPTRIEKKKANSINTEIRYIGMAELSALSDDELNKVKILFRKAYAQRLQFYRQIYINGTKQIDQSHIDSNINEASNITLIQLQLAAGKFFYGVRPELYLDDIKNLTQAKPPPLNKTEKPAAGPKMIKQKQNEQTTQFCIFLLTGAHVNSLSFLYSLESIVTQVYSKFRVIVIDNHFTDLTARIMKYHLTIIPESQSQRVTLFRTVERTSKGQILYQALKGFAKPEEVVVVLESGEEFVDKHILKQLNDRYLSSKALAVYGNSIYVQNDKIKVGMSTLPNMEVIRQKRYRQEPLYYESLRTFKFLLFSQIRKEEFIGSQGQWLEGNEAAIGYAIEELACENTAYISEILVRLPKKPEQLDPNITKQSSTGAGNAPKYVCVENPALNQLQANP